MKPPHPDPIPRLKREMAELIVQRTHIHSQELAGSLLRIDQPRMSNIRRGRLERFSLEQLIRLVSRAGGEIAITVTWTQGGWKFGARS